VQVLLTSAHIINSFCYIYMIIQLTSKSPAYGESGCVYENLYTIVFLIGIVLRKGFYNLREGTKAHESFNYLYNFCIQFQSNYKIYQA
jgi:hypothetical protein